MPYYNGGQNELGRSLLEGWQFGQQLGQRRKLAEEELALRQEAENRYQAAFELQRQQIEAAQAADLQRQAADQSIMQALFPQPQQQYADPGVAGMMGTMQGAGMMPQPPDLQQTIGQYGAMASPQVMRAATDTLQAKRQAAAEESQRQFQLQRMQAVAADMDREINARESTIRKAGGNPNDPVVQQVNQQLQTLYRRRAALQAGVDSLAFGVPSGTLMSSYDDVYKQQQDQGPSLTQNLALIKAQTDAAIAPLVEQRNWMQGQLEQAARAIGSSDPVALSGQRFMLPDGVTVSFADFVLRMQQVNQKIAEVQQGSQQALGGLGQPQMQQPQVPIAPPVGQPPATVAPQQLPDLVQVMAQIKAENPGISREAAIQLAKQRLGAN